MPLPSSPWNKDVKLSTKAQDGFKGSDPASPDKNGAPRLQEFKPMASGIDCRQAQHDELEVLRSIYMEDYEDVKVKGAWSVSACPFILLHTVNLTLMNRDPAILRLNST